MSTCKDVAVIILAAGKGTRMKSDLAKVLHKVDNKSMVAHVVEVAKKISPDHIHVVVGHQAQAVKEEIGNYCKVHFALQEKLLGTGDAVKTALPGVAPQVKDILVLCGDVPLIQKETLMRLIEGHRNNSAKVSVLVTDIDDPTGYGRIIIDQKNNLIAIREEADATPVEKQIRTVNTGIYCFDKGLLTRIIEQIKPDNNQAEYYLTDVIGIARQNSQLVICVGMDDPRQVIGVNTLAELGRAERFIKEFGR